jgi:N-hydroxyarylamine O-acetyltransferase
VSDRPPLDLDRYLRRIGYDGERAATVANLQALHLAHATHIPFENLDVRLGLPIRLDLASLQAKLVDGGRGGYCFEHNTLFAAVLLALGYAVTPLAARVRYRSRQILPRTHMSLLVEVEGQLWLADVGFGAEGLLLPVRFAPAVETCQYAWTYRLVEEPGLHVLQSLHGGAWLDLYAFTLEPQQAIDYEVANHYVSTHPDSRMVQTLTVQLPTPAARFNLVNGEYSEDRGGGTVMRRTLTVDEELTAVLTDVFGLRVPAGTRLPRPPA